MDKKATISEYIPKTGILKEDIYMIDNRSNILDFYGWYFTKSDQIDLIKEFSNKFELVVHSGENFISYLFNDKEYWRCLSNCSMSDMTSLWAEENLIINS